MPAARVGRSPEDRGRYFQPARSFPLHPEAGSGTWRNSAARGGYPAWSADSGFQARKALPFCPAEPREWARKGGFAPRTDAQTASQPGPGATPPAPRPAGAGLRTASVSGEMASPFGVVRNQLMRRAGRPSPWENLLCSKQATPSLLPALKTFLKRG